AAAIRGRILVAHELTGMVIEPETDAEDEGEVGEDIAGADPNFSVLDILWMNELDLVDLLHFAKQDGAGESVEVRPGDQAHVEDSTAGSPPLLRRRGTAGHAARARGAFHVAGLLELSARRRAAEPHRARSGAARPGDPAGVSRRLLGPPRLARSVFIARVVAAAGRVRPRDAARELVHAAGRRERRAADGGLQQLAGLPRDRR